jgi:hypothetical protein
LFLFAVVSLCASGLEISTGFLIGPRHDPRALYFRQQPGSPWRKSQAGKSTLALSVQRVSLQTPESNAFLPDGSLRADAAAALDAALKDAANRSVAVELILFDPTQDQTFDSPESLEHAVEAVTDWLIDRDHRHVILNPGGDWSAPGWDFDRHVSRNASQFAQRIRDRFQARRTDYLLPVALSVSNRLAPNSPLVQEADVLILSGEAVSADLRAIERPLLVVAADGSACGAATQRFAGCVATQGARLP